MYAITVPIAMRETSATSKGLCLRWAIYSGEKTREICISV